MLQNASYLVQKCNMVEQNSHYLCNHHPKICKKQVFDFIQQIWCRAVLCNKSIQELSLPQETAFCIIVFTQNTNSPEPLSPRSWCCSGLMAIVDGAMVYLKYFQKSKSALRLNREAKASSVQQNQSDEKHHTRLQTCFEVLLYTYQYTRWASRLCYSIC